MPVCFSVVDAIYAADTEAGSVGFVLRLAGGVGRLRETVKTLSSCRSAIDGVGRCKLDRE